MSNLDDILSGRGESAPAQEKPAEVETTQEATTEQAAESTETGAEGTPPADGQTMVPHAALHAEKQKIKRYTEQIASFEQKLNETNQAWERRLNKMLEAINKPQQQAPAPPPDFFENPQAATMHAVSPHLERMENVLMANAKLVATIKYDDKQVDEAERAFIRAYEAQTLDPADYQKVVNSPNRYAAAVQWHKRQQVAAEIGDDPVAFREKVKAELLAELQKNGDQPAQDPPAPVMPSNLATARNVGARAGPAWSGPKPLGDIFKR